MQKNGHLNVIYSNTVLKPTMDFKLGLKTILNHWLNTWNYFSPTNLAEKKHKARVSSLKIEESFLCKKCRQTVHYFSKNAEIKYFF